MKKETLELIMTTLAEKHSDLLKQDFTLLPDDMRETAKKSRTKKLLEIQEALCELNDKYWSAE